MHKLLPWQQGFLNYYGFNDNKATQARGEETWVGVPGVAEVLKREIAEQLQKSRATARLEEHLHTHKHTYTQTLLYNMWTVIPVRF